MLKNLPLFAPLVFTGRLVIFGSSLGDALVCASLSAVLCLQMYFDSKKQEPISQSVKDEIEQLKASIASIKLGKSLGRG
jgi:hypothetical protein